MKKNLFFFLQSLGLLLTKISSSAIASSTGESPGTVESPPHKDQIILKDGELLVEGIGKDFILQREDMMSINDFIDVSDPNKSIHGIPTIPVVPIHPGVY